MKFYMVMKDGRHVANVETVEQALEAAGVRLVELNAVDEDEPEQTAELRTAKGFGGDVDPDDVDLLENLKRSLIQKGGQI